MQLLSFTQNKDTVNGIVFNDLNNNGVLDTNEPGIADVCVSNQHEVVKTNANGQYTAILSVSGNGFMTPILVETYGYCSPNDYYSMVLMPMPGGGYVADFLICDTIVNTNPNCSGKRDYHRQTKYRR